MALDIFQKVNKQKKLKKKHVKKNKINLFQEEVNQTRENKTKNYHKIVKKFLKNVAASGFGVLTK